MLVVPRVAAPASPPKALSRSTGTPRVCPSAAPTWPKNWRPTRGTVVGGGWCREQWAPPPPPPPRQRVSSRGGAARTAAASAAAPVVVVAPAAACMGGGRHCRGVGRRWHMAREACVRPPAASTAAAAASGARRQQVRLGGAPSAGLPERWRLAAPGSRRAGGGEGGVSPDCVPAAVPLSVSAEKRLPPVVAGAAAAPSPRARTAKGGGRRGRRVPRRPAARRPRPSRWRAPLRPPPPSWGGAPRSTCPLCVSSRRWRRGGGRRERWGCSVAASTRSVVSLPTLWSARGAARTRNRALLANQQRHSRPPPTPQPPPPRTNSGGRRTAVPFGGRRCHWHRDHSCCFSFCLFYLSVALAWHATLQGCPLRGCSLRSTSFCCVTSARALSSVERMDQGFQACAAKYRTTRRTVLLDSYSRSPKNPALQQFQKCSKSASAGSWRPIWNSLGTVGVWGFWENGCTAILSTTRHSNC